MSRFYRRCFQLFDRLPKRRPVARVSRGLSPSGAVPAIERLESRQLLTVTFHGGALLTAVETQGVYLGSDWQSNTTLQAQTSQINTYLNTLVTGQYMDMLTNAGYGVSRGTSSTGAMDPITLNKTQGISDASIQQDLQSMISANKLQTPDANRLYVVYVEPGVVVQNGSASSATTFLGYHGAFAGHTSSGAAADIHYAVIPYPGGVNPTPSSQGFSNSFDEQTAVTSHEVAEAVTDPNVNYKTLSWYDDQLNGEIGDLTRLTVVFNGYVVQDMVDKNDQVISPNSSNSTLNPPQNVIAASVSSTAASLSWTGSSGALGYRIYQVIGTQSVLLGTVGATVSSVQITGLTAGSTVSFKVQAYNATTTADSQVASVTLSTSSLAAPVASATILSASSIRLNWTKVSGTDGYNIYFFDGTTRVYLGTVGASVTSVQITGLTPGITYPFQVEAYHRGSVSESNWVSVNTTGAQHVNHILTPPATTPIKTLKGIRR